MARNTVARTLHDVGLAAWFGGSLMGAVGLNTASGKVTDPTDRARVASAGWAAWAPVSAVAIGAHLLGGALVVRSNKGRIKGQKGVAGWTGAKTALTAGAVAVTAYSGLQGRKVQTAGSVPSSGGTSPSVETPAETATAQKRLAVLQTLIPALTGAIVVANVVMGEQQRPSEVAKGVPQRVAQAVTSAPQAALHAVSGAPQAALHLVGH